MARADWYKPTRMAYAEAAKVAMRARVRCHIILTTTG